MQDKLVTITLSLSQLNMLSDILKADYDDVCCVHTEMLKYNCDEKYRENIELHKSYIEELDKMINKVESAIKG